MLIETPYTVVAFQSFILCMSSSLTFLVLSNVNETHLSCEIEPALLVILGTFLDIGWKQLSPKQNVAMLG